MNATLIELPGDTHGVAWQVPVLQFAANTSGGPDVYIQAALHADELPGTAVAHFLCTLLRRAQTAGSLTGNVTIVPQANPFGLSQQSAGHMQGRFDRASRVNFNREFDLIALADREKLLEVESSEGAVTRLKKRLLHMALGADIVIDLHCDDESLLYAYLPSEFWPDAQDFAACMKLQSVFVSDGHSTAFEEAVAHAWRHDTRSDQPRRMATTLELRGQRDVSKELARADAQGLFEFLTARGVVSSDSKPETRWHGTATPLDHIELVRTPSTGTVLAIAQCGDEVKKGDVLAQILARPGHDDATINILAPQDGTVITRTSARYAPRGHKLYKIACTAPTQSNRPPGALES